MEKLFGALFSAYRGTPAQGSFVLNCLQGAWPKLLGDRLASVCRPVSYQDSTLTIEVIDPQWKETVRGIQRELLDKLRAATAGEVARLIVTNRQPPADR